MLSRSVRSYKASGFQAPNTCDNPTYQQQGANQGVAPFSWPVAKSFTVEKLKDSGSDNIKDCNKKVGKQ
jgi:hypothetical protein